MDRPTVLFIPGISRGSFMVRGFVTTLHQPQHYGSRTRVPEPRPCPPPWWEPAPSPSPSLSAPFVFSGLLSGLVGRAETLAVPAPPPPAFTGAPHGSGHCDSHISHSCPRGPFFEGGFFSGFLRKQRVWQGFRRLVRVGRDGRRGKERIGVRTWLPVKKKVLELNQSSE